MLIKSVDFSRDYYEILGLGSQATSEDIKKTYREMAKKYHPDLNKSSTSEELFKLISEAYEVLSDEAKRTQYDLYRKFELGEDAQEEEDAEAEKAHAPDGGMARTGGLNVPDTNVKRPVKPRVNVHVRPRVPEKDRTQLLVLSLIVPGYYQIFAGEKKFGYILFGIYFIFWTLAFIQSLPIGILALVVWLYSFYDAYSHTVKDSTGSA